MNKKEFLEMLESNKEKDITIEVEGQILQKATMYQYIYQIIEDRLYIRNKTNLDFAVINLNIIRQIQKTPENIILYLEDKDETIIKLSIN